MNAARALSSLGAVACLFVVVVLAAPALVVEGVEGLLRDYYAAGPTGAVGIGFFAAIGVVVFLSGERGSADPPIVAGLATVLGGALVVLSVVWIVSMDSTTVFSFPVEYDWIEYHRYVVLGLSLLALVAAAGYAREYV
ncbi:MAG: hypothetical protein V5A46_06450 [Haloferacaceae archaeon]